MTAWQFVAFLACVALASSLQNITGFALALILLGLTGLFNLAPLVMIADRLPIEDEARAQLLGFSPRGSVNDLVVKWQGAWQAPER